MVERSCWTLHLAPRKGHVSCTVSPISELGCQPWYVFVFTVASMASDIHFPFPKLKGKWIEFKVLNNNTGSDTWTRQSMNIF